MAFVAPGSGNSSSSSGGASAGFQAPVQQRAAPAGPAPKKAAAPPPPKKKKKNIFQDVEGAVGGAVKAVTHAVPAVAKGLTTSEQAVATPIARLLPGGQNDLKAANAAIDANLKNQKMIRDLHDSGKISMASYTRLTKLNTQHIADTSKMVQQTTSDINKSTNIKHVAGGAFGTAADILTAGALPELKSAVVAARLGKGAKVADVAAQTGKDAAIFGGQNVAQQEAQNGKVNLKEAGVAATVGAVLPGAAKAGGKILSTADKQAGKLASVTATKLTGSPSLQVAGEKGIVRAADRAVSNAGRKVVYKASDALAATRGGQKLISSKDSFASHFIDTLAPVYKTAKRLNFEGDTAMNSDKAIRAAVGNANRSDAFAQRFIKDDPDIKQLGSLIAARGKNTVKTGKAFHQYAEARSDLDLAKAGKKTFSDEKMTALQHQMNTSEDFSKEYDHLVGAYKNLNDYRLDKGLINEKTHQAFKDDPLDYVRVQRELPDVAYRKGSSRGNSRSLSVTKNDIQKRNEFASGNQLNPLETYVHAVRTAHNKALSSEASKTIYDALAPSGNATLLRSTADVEQKRALLTKLSEGKPIARQLDKTVRQHKGDIQTLQKELDNLNKQGLQKRLKAVGEGTPDYHSNVLDQLKTLPGKSNNTRELAKTLVTEDPRGLKQIRNMIEARNPKLKTVLGKLENTSKELHSVNADRKALYQQAQGIKTTIRKGHQPTFSFLDKGEENIVKTDPDVAAAVNNWDEQSNNVLTNFLRATNNIFKYGTTGANVAFAIPNLAADQVESAFNSRALLYTHNPVNFVRSLFIALGKPLSKKDAQIAAEYGAGNGKALSVNQYTREVTAGKKANELMREHAGKLSNTYTYIVNPKEGAHALFEGLENTVGVTENLTRAANFRGMYNKGLKQGLSKEEAVKGANLAARENSIDFSAMGDYGRVLNNMIPYFNAAIQGTRQIFRTMAERPVSASAKMATLVMTPVAATTIWNTEDKKRNEIYKTIPDYVKQANFVVITPGAHYDDKTGKWDGVIIMKKPPGLAPFAEPVRKYIEYVNDNDPSKKKTLGGFLKEQGLPTANEAAANLSPVNYQRPTASTPQVIKPFLEGQTNKDFYTGKSIVPDYLKDVAPGQQVYTDKEGTQHYSQLSKDIAAKLNTSPMQIDHFIKDTFGEVGTNIQNTADRLITKDKNHQGGRSLGESISRRFAGAPAGADTDAFYAAYNPADSKRTEVSKQVTNLIKQNKDNQAERVAEEYNKTIESRFKGFKTKFGNSPNYDSSWDDKIKKLQIDTSVRAFNTRYSNATK